MFLTPHAAVGILIGTQTTNPIAAFIFSFLSHFVLDLIPHGDQGLAKWVKAKHTKRRAAGILAADAGVMTLLVASLVQQVNFPHPYVTIAAVMGGILPDVLSGWYEYTRDLFPQHRKERLFAKTGFIARATRRFFFDAKFLMRHHRVHHKYHWRLGVTIPLPAGIALQAVLLVAVFVTTIRIMS